MPKTEVPTEFVRALNDLGLSNASSLYGNPLTGGVSSDIWCIETEKGFVCAKRALSKLRVAADWHAPVERNLFEARWLQVARQASAACAPELLGQHPELGVLVMQYLDPIHYRLWKQELHAGTADAHTAIAMGQVLSKIHSYAARNSQLASEFPTDKIFFEIRLAPYLVATAARYPKLAPALHALVEQTQSHAKTLVHGDVSLMHQGFGVVGVLRVEGDADAQGGCDAAAFGQGDGLMHAVDDLVGDQHRIIFMVNRFEQHGKLVAAQARNGVALTQLGAQALGNGDQHSIACGVAELIVDFLETVAVEKQHSHLRLAVAGFAHAAEQTRFEEGAVGQASQGIVAGLMRQRGVLAFQLMLPGLQLIEQGVEVFGQLVEVGDMGGRYALVEGALHGNVVRHLRQVA